MPAPLSLDLRHRFIKAYENKEGSLRELAQRFAIGEATADRWWSRYKRTGEIAARPMGGDRHSKFDEDSEAVLEFLVYETPDLTIPELVDALHDEIGLQVSTAAVSRALKRLGLTRKKRLRNGTRNA
jgi:transposase